MMMSPPPAPQNGHFQQKKLIGDGKMTMFFPENPQKSSTRVFWSFPTKKIPEILTLYTTSGDSGKYLSNIALRVPREAGWPSKSKRTPCSTPPCWTPRVYPGCALAVFWGPVMAPGPRRRHVYASKQALPLHDFDRITSIVGQKMTSPSWEKHHFPRSGGDACPGP